MNVFDGFLLFFRRRWYLKKIQERIDKAQSSRARVERESESFLLDAKTMQQRAEKSLQRLEESVSRLKTENQTLSQELTAVQSELRLAKEITIPGLVAANDVLVRRFEAESRVQVLRASVASKVTGGGSSD